ncbi:hypothetical protein KAR91_49040 [Candidatus Pacearchaeota archaeon]|nr:hypothetical protein [Candidatus Pacearchaeota archaeon]
MSTLDLHPPKSRPASYGVLENALDNAEVLMELLQDTVEKIDVTGQLKLKYLNGHTQIELLAIPKTTPDILGEPHQSTEMHQLLLETFKDDLKWFEDNPGHYEWQGKYYTWKLTALIDESQWTIAQIWHTGPEYFTKWLLASKAHRGGALPWGYHIRNYRLNDSNRMPIPVKTESEFWEALGYLSIPLEDRSSGNPQYWRTFELVRNAV